MSYVRHIIFVDVTVYGLEFPVWTCAPIDFGLPLQLDIVTLLH